MLQPLQVIIPTSDEISTAGEAYHFVDVSRYASVIIQQIAAKPFKTLI